MLVCRNLHYNRKLNRTWNFSGQAMLFLVGKLPCITAAITRRNASDVSRDSSVRRISFTRLITRDAISVMNKDIEPPMIGRAGWSDTKTHFLRLPERNARLVPSPRGRFHRASRRISDVGATDDVAASRRSGDDLMRNNRARSRLPSGYQLRGRLDVALRRAPPRARGKLMWPEN